MGIWNKLTGRFFPDPKPVEIPAGMRRPESLQEMMARVVSTHISQIAANNGFETEDEASDFDVDSDRPEDQDTRYQQMADDLDHKEDFNVASREVGRIRGERAVKERNGNGGSRNEERGRGGSRGEEDAEWRRQSDRRVQGSRASDRSRGKSREDENADERG